MFLRRGLAVSLLLGVIFLSPCSARGQQQRRIAVPGEAAVADAKQLIAEVYKQDYDKAKTPLERQALAKKLLDAARNSQDEPAARYALLEVTRKMAVALGDVATAMQAIDETATAFEIVAGDEKGAVLAELAKQAKTPDDNYLLARYILPEFESLLATDNLQTAQQFATLAQTVTRKSRETDLLKQWTRRQESLKERLAAFTAAQAANATLKTSPLDKDANRIAGEYQAFWKHDWKVGIPLLALGNDAPLAPVATQDLRGVKTAVEQVALADAWYDASLQRGEEAKRALQLRAEHYYAQALPSLQALTLARIQKRIEAIREANCPFPKSEWVEILDRVELPKHLVQHQWQREALSVVTRQTEHDKIFRIPVEIEGNFELKIQATLLADGDSFGITLSRPVKSAQFVHAGWGGKVTGINHINGQLVPENPSKTPAISQVAGRKYEVIVLVETRGDQAVISSMQENRRHLHWVGSVASLSSPSFANARPGSLHVSHNGQGIAIHSVQLKLKTGTAWVVD